MRTQPGQNREETTPTTEAIRNFLTEQGIHHTTEPKTNHIKGTGTYEIVHEPHIIIDCPDKEITILIHDDQVIIETAPIIKAAEFTWTALHDKKRTELSLSDPNLLKTILECYRCLLPPPTIPNLSDILPQKP